MSNTPWIPLNDSTESETRLAVELFVPPHDVPQAVRGNFDENLDRFVIEIRYLDDEDYKLETMDRIVGLRVGKNSQRLLGVELNTKELGVSEVQLKINAMEQEIVKARQHLLNHNSSGSERDNYTRAMEAIESKISRLLDSDILASAH